jgi:hypothetical protein
LLARFVVDHPLGSGKSVYLRELPGATEQDLEAWAEAGWLKKSVCCYSADDEELVVNEDPDTGDWYDEHGSFVRSSDLVTNYMTTDKAHETPEAKAAAGAILALQLRARLADAYERAVARPGPAGVEEAFRLRFCLNVLDYEGSLTRDPFKGSLNEITRMFMEGPE